MFRHHLIIIYRNFLRFRTTFFINLIGLSSGLTFALLIYLWVNDELSVDKFHANDKQLYQVMRNINSDGEIFTTPTTPGLLAKALPEDVPEIEHSVPILQAWFEDDSGILSVGKNKIKATEQYVGESFFDVFSFKLIEGDKQQVFADKNALLISDELGASILVLLITWFTIGIQTLRVAQVNPVQCLRDE